MTYPGATYDPPDGMVVYPHDLMTGFLIPNYGTKIKATRRMLLAVAEDGTRTGRVKSGQQFGFDLVYKNRPREWYLTLLSFWSTEGYAEKFAYYDKLLDLWYILSFDSEIEAEYVSFDEIDFTISVIGTLYENPGGGGGPLEI